ncbi:hypothetical protein [Micromonospora sp. WMMD964]|uniref:hypothetical protein n=1 Tax=Micromonospora sp. WMMD964 TaxID=3016091 RepID=UPI00249A6DC3|nr:hypothetical protein [Micromonospora sp. WMMD964]WFF00077.1 hypothetical protein O7616_24750 [Micromonospora sp. WMMD964]
MGDVRGRFRDDLAHHPAPPLGDLVERAMVQGRRLRRRRRLAQVGAGGSALVMLVVIGLVGGPLGVGTGDDGPPGGMNVGSLGGRVDTTTPSPAGTTDGFVDDAGGKPGGALNPAMSPTPSTTVIDTVRIGAGPGGELLTATPQGALELLTRLLPKGKTGGYASLQSSGAGPGMPYVQLHLDRGEGPGMLRLSVYQDRLGDNPAPGTVELTEVPDNCVQNEMVTVYHHDGLQVDVMISTCLFWEGKGTSPAPPALSVDEAIAIAANPTWGTRIPAELVRSGAKNFASLARSNG